MQDNELDAVLGDFAAAVADEAREKLAGVLEVIGERYAEGPGLPDAQTGALMLALGDATLAEIAAEHAAARDAERHAMAKLVGAMLWADAEGTPHLQIATTTGLSRTTVRKALSDGEA